MAPLTPVRSGKQIDNPDEPVGGISVFRIQKGKPCPMGQWRKKMDGATRKKKDIGEKNQ